MHDLQPCDWEPIFSNCAEGGTCSHLDGMPAEVAEAVTLTAVTWLWEATNRRYSNCPVTVIPCRQGCAGYGTSPPFIPYKTTSGTWMNWRCGRCPGDCSCTSIDQLTLPTIGDVISVDFDGIPMDEADWRLDNHRWLVRRDGGTWPVCQDLAYAEFPEFSVTYIPGLAAPVMGQLAAGTFACQLARRYCGAKCDLPSNTTNVTRQGVTIAISPIVETGLWVVDQWVALANKAIPMVRSPDLVSPRLVESIGS